MAHYPRFTRLELANAVYTADSEFEGFRDGIDQGEVDLVALGRALEMVVPWDSSRPDVKPAEAIDEAWMWKLTDELLGKPDAMEAIADHRARYGRGA